MKQRPIPFSAPMVLALLAGTKTQTRRVLGKRAARLDPAWPLAVSPRDEKLIALCPYGQPGDRLWVREAWRSGRLTDRFPPREMTPHPVWYEADGAAPDACNGKLRPAMFMPRWASRITLELTGVRAERLQDISEADAQAEGCHVECMTPTGDDSGSAIHGPGGYMQLWESINGSGSWAANPWVWVVEFRRIDT